VRSPHAFARIAAIDTQAAILPTHECGCGRYPGRWRRHSRHAGDGGAIVAGVGPRRPTEYRPPPFRPPLVRCLPR
jgi:hypothetical protein